MRRWTIGLSVLLVVIVVLIILFSGDEAGETTTTTFGGSTTSSIEGTTTTGEGTSTTTGETTTTAEGTTTTTAAGGLEGNWADEPLIAAGFGALGWWDGGGWVQVDEGTSLPIVGGEDYQIALLGLEATTTGGGEELLCEPLNNPGVILADEEALGDFPGPLGVAISADWVLTPHFVEESTDDGTYAAAASALLAERGLTVANPVIKQVIRVDLEGDGVNEVLVVAEDVPVDLLAEEGDYSIAFLQKVVEGEVATSVIGESVVLEQTEGETPFVLSFTVAALADMNDDSRMEIILDSAYYEGIGVEVWEYVNDDIGPMAQISAGCGSWVENPFEDRTTFVGYIGIVLTDASADHAVGRIEITDNHHQPYGVVHGGVYCTLIETLASTGGAIWAMENGMAGVVGVNNQTDFLRATRDGVLVGEATPIHRGRTQQLWQVTVIREGDGKLAARGQVRLQNIKDVEAL